MSRSPLNSLRFIQGSVSLVMKIKCALGLISLVWLAIGCTAVQTTNSGAIGINRKQYMAVSEQTVEQGAIEAYNQELDKARKNNALNTHAPALERVRKISQRLIPQTTVFRPDASQWQWEVNVETSKEVNAYCMPGGKIMVYTGLIEKLEATDAELAAVIGHEMAHALREHSRERMSRQYGQQIALAVAAIATGAGEGMMNLAGMVSDVTFTLPHSREQESEADLIGLELIARAGYDPRASVSLWQKMMREADNAPPQFMSTHPSSATRIKDLQTSLPKVLPLYQSAKRAE